jgi:hypothetical protein
VADQTFARTQVEALAARLNAIDFSDEERTMLHAVFRAGTGGAEVEGFGDVRIGQIDTAVTQAGTPSTLTPEAAAALIGNVLGAISNKQKPHPL